VKPFLWLDRGFVHGPYYTLCLNEKDFKAALKHLKCEAKSPFLKTEHANATTHFLLDPEGKQCAIVCMGTWSDQTGISIAGLLVHEATHIFQEWCEHRGEYNPGREFEAYSIQWLSQQLMWEFERQTKRR
jgi:hypothetical protein